MFDQNTLRLLYYHYRAYITPVVVISMCVFLVWMVIVPQMSQWQRMREEEKRTQEKVKRLTQTTQFFSTLEDTVLESQFQTLAKALPAEKDFAGVINAISQAARESNVSLGDFFFEVGNLSTPSAQKEVASVPHLSIQLSIDGSDAAVNHFMNVLGNTFPLSEVLSIQRTGKTTALQTVFYYKPYVPQGLSDVEDVTATALSQEQQSVIEQLTPMMAPPSIPLSTSSATTP